jgi:hypothetical protein
LPWGEAHRFAPVRLLVVLVCSVHGIRPSLAQYQTTNALFEVRRGKLILNGGVLQADTLVLTNYLDIGATTNATSRFYRIRLAP